MSYEKTHQRFKYYHYWTEIVPLCREMLGDNDPYQPLHLRPWFTNSSGEVYIRKDLVESTPIATYMALRG